MIVEVHGVEVFGHHGVGEHERRDGQAFLVDVTLLMPEPSGDTIDATVDYRRVRDLVRAVNESGSFQLIETFAAAIADSIREELVAEQVRVRVRKPGVAWAEWTAATVERP
jgi:dihydroneopterin aldolase